MAQRPARSVVPRVPPPPPAVDPWKGNAPLKPLPVGMMPLGIDQLQGLRDENGNDIIDNGTYGYDEPTDAMIDHFTDAGFAEPHLAFICAQVMSDHVATRSPSHLFIRKFRSSNITLKCNTFTLNLLSFLMITLCNGGFGQTIPVSSGSMAMMKASRPRDAREGMLFFNWVEARWPVLYLEGYNVLTLTEEAVEGRCAEGFLQSIKKPGVDFGVHSEEGVGEHVTAIHGNPNNLTRGLFLPHAIILHMISRRTHYNTMRQDGWAKKNITQEQWEIYSEIPALYSTGANDSPFFIPAGRTNRLP